MFVDGQIRRMARYAWSIAAINLVLSLILTPLLGLEGVALGTTCAYLAVLPFWVRFVVGRFEISIGQLARQAWLPAYVGGGAAAAAALTGRLALDVGGPVEVVVTLAASTLLGWTIVYFAFLSGDERRLVRSLGPARRAPGVSA